MCGCERQGDKGGDTGGEVERFKNGRGGEGREEGDRRAQGGSTGATAAIIASERCDTFITRLLQNHPKAAYATAQYTHRHINTLPTQKGKKK